MAEIIAFVTRLANTVMAPSPPSFPNFQSLPPELRNKIYDLLVLTETRKVSCRRLLELHKVDPNYNKLWKQFQACIPLHPLSMTCRQLRAEFSPMFATRSMVGAPSYSLIVNNIDLDQLTIVHRHLDAHCFTHMFSDRKVPPLHWDNVSLCLKLDSNIHQSAQDFCDRMQWGSRGSFGRTSLLWNQLKVVVLPETGSRPHVRSTYSEVRAIQKRLIRTTETLHQLLFKRRFRGVADDQSDFVSKVLYQLIQELRFQASAIILARYGPMARSLFYFFIILAVSSFMVPLILVILVLVAVAVVG